MTDAKPDHHETLSAITSYCQQLPELDLSLYSMKKVISKTGNLGTIRIIKKIQTGEYFTIKKIKTDGPTSPMLAIFMKECTILQSHIADGIIPEYHGAYKNKNNYYILSKWDENYVELFTWLQTSKIKLLRKNQLITTLIRLVCRLHHFGVAHLGIKLSNILVHTKTLELKFIDFGFSCMELDNSCMSVITSYMYYPYGYINPELDDNKHNPTSFKDKILVDYFSVGICIYQLLSNDYNEIKYETTTEQFSTALQYYYTKVVTFFTERGISDGNLVRNCTLRAQEIRKYATTYPEAEFYKEYFPDIPLTSRTVPAAASDMPVHSNSSSNGVGLFSGNFGNPRNLIYESDKEEEDEYADLYGPDNTVEALYRPRQNLDAYPPYQVPDDQGLFTANYYGPYTSLAVDENPVALGPFGFPFLKGEPIDSGKKSKKTKKIKSKKGKKSKSKKGKKSKSNKK